MFKDIQNDFDSGIRQMAESKLIKKLNDQGISRSDISSSKFQELLDMEIKILKSDGKKVGAGIGVGLAISLFTGGLF